MPFARRLTFEPGQSKVCIDVNITDDTVVENTETFYVDMMRTPNLNARATIDEPRTASIDITDNDG